MARPETSFKKIVRALEAHYGPPPAPPVSDPLHLILYESIGYLVDDDRRNTAFAALRRQVGLKPTDLLAASGEQLVEITKLGGIHPEMRAQRLKEIAQIVLIDFEGDLGIALKLPLPKAIKELEVSLDRRTGRGEDPAVHEDVSDLSPGVERTTGAAAPGVRD